MADKTYRMTVTLSDGNTVDAGTFVAPQGPAGPQGPSGALSDWQVATANTELDDGTYLIAVTSTYDVGVAIVRNGHAHVLVSYSATTDDSTIIGLEIVINNKKYSHCIYSSISSDNIEVVQITDFQPYQYTKII